MWDWLKGCDVMTKTTCMELLWGSLLDEVVSSSSEWQIPQQRWLMVMGVEVKEEKWISVKEM